jgi:acyl carrier protein
MMYRAKTRCHWMLCVACLLTVTSCRDRAPVAVVAVKPGSTSTADQVCDITAELLSVDRSKITLQTSLGELKADDLDFVELVMELEEHFDIAIPDEAAERMMETDNWQQGLKHVTMAKLAALVDQQKQRSQSRPPPE